MNNGNLYEKSILFNTNLITLRQTLEIFKFVGIQLYFFILRTTFHKIVYKLTKLNVIYLKYIQRNGNYISLIMTLSHQKTLKYIIINKLRSSSDQLFLIICCSKINKQLILSEEKSFSFRFSASAYQPRQQFHNFDVLIKLYISTYLKIGIP